jgi:hypothetical protein
MRYLYGDSTPFPLSYDFLGTLEAFMTAATRAVKLHDDAVAIEVKAAEAKQTRLAGIQALESFHLVVMKAIGDTATKVSHPSALEYAGQVGELAQRFVEEQWRQVNQANERDAGTVAREVAQRRVDAHAATEEFFLKAALTVEGSTTRATLHGHRYETTATFKSAGGMTAGYQLRASAPWDAPRKVSDFAKGTTLKVAVKKSFFKGVVTAEPMPVDDFVVSHVEVTDSRVALTLRKKVTEPDSLVFQLVRAGETLVASVEHPGNMDASTLPPELDDGDAAQLDRLAIAVSESLRTLHPNKERLTELKLDDRDAMGGLLIVELVERFVALFAPIVVEIAERSSNEHELSLKAQNDGGRREEVYLRKADLVEKLQPLWQKGRTLFAPLGLDTWVPTMTMAPPPVAAVAPVAVAPIAPVAPPSGKLPG